MDDLNLLNVADDEITKMIIENNNLINELKSCSEIMIDVMKNIPKCEKKVNKLNDFHLKLEQRMHYSNKNLKN